MLWDYHGHVMYVMRRVRYRAVPHLYNGFCVTVTSRPLRRGELNTAHVLHARLGSGKLPRFGPEGQGSLGPAFLSLYDIPLIWVLRELHEAFPFLNIWQEEGGAAS